MCYFVTIGIRGSIMPEVKEAFPRGMAIWQCENRKIMSYMSPEVHAFAVTTGMCSCDIYHWASSGDPQGKIHRIREKYRKKGWSESKIARAVEEAAAASVTKSVTKPSGLRADAREAISRVADRLGAVYVFAHFYRGNQTTEDVTVNIGPTIRAEDFQSGVFVLPPDTLVTVVSKANR